MRKKLIKLEEQLWKRKKEGKKRKPLNRSIMMQKRKTNVMSHERPHNQHRQVDVNKTPPVEKKKEQQKGARREKKKKKKKSKKEQSERKEKEKKRKSKKRARGRKRESTPPTPSHFFVYFEARVCANPTLVPPASCTLAAIQDATVFS